MAGETDEAEQRRRWWPNTTPPVGRRWCAWCEDQVAVGVLTLVDDTGDPIEGPLTPTTGKPMCGTCGWGFHGAPSTAHEAGTYVFDPEEGA